MALRFTITNNSETSASSSTLMAGRTMIYSDDDNPDSISNVTISRGYATPRSDGKIAINLNEELASTDLTLTYDKTTGETTTPVEITLPVSENLYKESGWAKGKFYLPETDSNDAIVIEPRPDTRFIHISTSGLTREQILARHDGSGDALDGLTDDPLPRAALFDTPARDAGGTVISPTTYYGETEALAVDSENGDLIHLHNRQDDQFPVIVKFKAGDEFTGLPLTNVPQVDGYSPLHPNAITSYGAGAKPKFTGVGSTPKYASTTYGTAIETGSYTHKWILQDIETDGIAILPGSGDHLLVDNCKTVGNRIANEGGVTHWSLTGTVRRCVSLDSMDPYGSSMRFDGGTAAFTAGETVTGTNSGATGYIQFVSGSVSSGRLFVRLTSLVNFDDNEPITDSAGGAGVVNDPGVTWSSGQNGAYDGMRFNIVQNLLVEKNFISGSGWSFNDVHGISAGYRPDRSGLAGKSPTQYSHCVYSSTACHEVYYRQNIFLNGCHSNLQIRSGGIVDGFFGAGCNTGWSPVGNGPTDAERLKGRGSPACWSMGFRIVQTEAGWKDLEPPYSPIIAGGLGNNSNEFCAWDSIVINSTPTPGSAKTPFTDATAVTFGQPYEAKDGDGETLPSTVCFAIRNSNSTSTSAMPLDANFIRNEVIVSDHNFNPTDASDGDLNLGGVPEATRRALTIADYADTAMSSSGETLRTFDLNYLRTLDAPWEELPGLVNYFLDPWDKGIPSRSVAQTVTYRADSGNWTPGQLCMFAGDTDTKDLPGRVDGDSIAFDGPVWYWLDTPKNSITNVDFTNVSRFEMWGGKLAPTGTITVPATLTELPMWQGSKLHISATPASNTLKVQPAESRVLMDGQITDNLDIAAIGRSEVVFYEGGDVTFASGRELEVSGNVDVGFDGSGGGAAAVEFATGSTLSLKRGCIMQVDGGTIYPGRADVIKLTSVTGDDPEVGDAISGGTSGAAGTIDLTAQDAGWEMVITTSSGTFELGETISGPGWSGTYSSDIGRTGMWDTVGVPKVGDVIEGETSGATAVVGGCYRTANFDFELHLDNVAGEFQNDENLLGPTWAGPYLIGDSRDGLGATPGEGTDDLVVLGQVNGAPTYTLPTIKEFQTGINGTAAPSVASAVTCGGTIEVDVTGMTGTVTLIEADSITGTFATETITGSANSLVYDTGSTPNTVKLTV